MNKHPWRYWLTYLYCSIWDIPVWLFVFLLRGIMGQKLHWYDGFWFELKEKSWFVQTFYKKWGGVTLGHGGFYREGKTKDPNILDTEIEIHEHVHVEQYEAVMLDAFFTGASVFLVLYMAGRMDLGVFLGGGLWFTGYLRMLVSNWIQAWMRGEKMYSGSAHEESAYAIAEKYMRDKEGLK